MTRYFTTSSFTSRKLAVAAVGGLLAATCFSGAGLAVTDTIFKYTTEKTGYFGIDAMAMAPAGNLSADDYVIDWVGGLFANSTQCFNTGVNLPNGATITQLAIWTTSGTVSNPFVWFLRKKLTDGVPNTIVNAVASDNSATRKQKNFSIANTAVAVVNNAQYVYGLGVCVGDDDVFHAARITYTYTNAGD
jgi:hypothetical protein